MHGSLIARNVVLADGNVPKLTDYAVPRSGSGAQVKWLAPEVLLALREKRGASTAAADVFSYGYILYAIFAQQMPWKGVSQRDVEPRVVGGERLPLPNTMPPWVRAAASPRRRPFVRACA